ncbi:hypothetical protein HSBGL_1942 [Halapricum desulfuricans]|uniref:Uncharacterized protein n=1 Tax=Halapricum desulfuricans TaxID=2841257 RepID=A0A897NHY6_9EURY|nr:hypothetical protein HSBGL_1942 [Halapricum desulfuricans]
MYGAFHDNDINIIIFDVIVRNRIVEACLVVHTVRRRNHGTGRCQDPAVSF